MLKGSVALVTGSTRGIGHGILSALASAGADVVAHGLPVGDESELKRLDEIREMHSVRTDFSTADLRDPAQIRDMISGVQRKMGSLDILVNNAGMQYVRPVHELPDDKWDEILAVVLSSTFHATKAAVPMMMKKGWGRVVNTGSMHALVASPYKSAYNAAKHGVAGFTKTVGLELAQTGVTCNSVCPG